MESPPKIGLIALTSISNVPSQQLGQPVHRVVIVAVLGAIVEEHQAGLLITKVTQELSADLVEG